ncbi:hypothetical protein PV355_01820 [Streptomyces stelliscabiei]|uniref:hypothetical protein n=1 Tax=Streptomyces stelliscabiei TaxID=146820 RepID=UPI0029B594AB|nr:hypothetical protein [Streptomyces stelliscabiei]MDX2513905.1 hypothetical protein [Streptomyces stelliscabiei]
MSADELAAAVAKYGALPVPVGPEPLSAERLAGIEARADAATAGPWCTDAWEIYQGTEYVPGISFWIGETCRGTSELGQDRADAAFVAAARSDVPVLVAEVRRQAARIAELEAERLRVRTEAIADVGGFLEEVGEKGAAYLVRTVDILAARDPEPDAVTKVFVPVASLREPDGEHYPLVHHDWRLGRDLPEGGLQ